MSFLYGEAERTGNIVVDHWNGSYALPRAFWINYFLIGNILTMAVVFAAMAVMESNLSLQLISLAQVCSIAFALIIWIWSIVGIWRSASAHEQRGGSAAWAGLAKLIVILGALGTAGQYTQKMPGIVETAQIALGGDSFGESATIAVVGDSLTITGTLASGASLDVAEVLQKHPSIQRVILSSIGGRQIEGTRIGEMIRGRSLDTHVDGTCESACTLALLAGKKRTASFGSAVGFHQPSFPGTTPSEEEQMIEELRQEYKGAGLPYTFVRRAMQAKADGMWYPTEEELFQASVLNAMDTERVSDDQLASAKNINRKLPLPIDDITTLVRAKAIRNVLVQEFEVTLSRNQFDHSFMNGEFVEIQRRDLCSRTLVPMLIEAGAIYEFVYRDNTGKDFVNFNIDHC